MLFGPTASGKTEILERLFAGPDALCPAEIISADSMQVYRGMDLGTAKPSRELRSRLPHHLIDIRDPKEQFNAGEFVRLAAAAVQDIARRGALPVISGGTGFYLASFVTGLPAAPPSSAEIREALRKELEQRGADTLWEELSAADPPSAARIHPHDTYRVLRALEVYRLSGRPLSSFPRPAFQAADSIQGEGSRFLLIGLEREREEVYRRIDERCRRMFREGLPGEVRKLWEAGYGPGDPGMRAIGYREFFVPGEDGRERLSEDMPGVEALTARNSRRYAKRQITYFASLPGVTWVSASAGSADPEGPVRKIRELITEKLLV